MTTLPPSTRSGTESPARARPGQLERAAAQRHSHPRPAHPVDQDHTPHLLAALAWIGRAQDVTATGGIARGYSLVHHRHFGGRGWQADYPETTGYIIPTLFAAADRFAREDLVARAMLAATWECGIQLHDGSVRGGMITEPLSPSVFNTGQVLLGWLSAFQRSGDWRYADAARAGAQFLIDALDHDGIWRRAHSLFACPGDALYNARTAWALAAAAEALGMPAAREAAARALGAVAARQHGNGWLPDCCLTDSARPLLHTIAYAVTGLLEGGRLLGDDRLIGAARSTAAALADRVDIDGRLPGRLGADWRGASSWSCLTGQAQMVSNWIRLFEITGDRRWLEPVPAVVTFLKATQDRHAGDPGLAGGITGSDPVSGGYGPHEVLSWATKFFVDALLLDERVGSRTAGSGTHALLLA